MCFLKDERKKLAKGKCDAFMIVKILISLYVILWVVMLCQNTILKLER